MRRYRNMGVASPFGLILGLIVGVFLSVAVGLVSFAFATFVVYLVPIHPLAVALIAAGVSAVVMRIGKVRSLLLGMLLGALIGALIYGVSRAAEYGYAVYQEAQTYAGKESDLLANWGVAQRDIDRLLERQTGQGGVIGYVLFSAEQGMTISRFSATSTSSGGIVLDRNLTLIYFGLELLGTVPGGVLGAAAVARQPFHPKEKRWVRDQDFRLFGTVDLRARHDFTTALEQSDFARAGTYLTPGPGPGIVQVSAMRLGDQTTDDVLLRLSQPEGRRTKQTYGVLSAGEFQQFLSGARRSG